MVYSYVGGDRIMPAMIGMLVGTNADVRMAHGITSPVSGLVEDARTNFLCLNASNSASLS